MNRVALSLLYGAALSIAHTIDNAHAHEQCAFTVDGDSFNITALQRKDQMWSVHDTVKEQSYFFNLCGDATQVYSTQCTDVNNTKMPVFGCQITYGRPSAVILGDTFSIEHYTNGALPNGHTPDFPITNGIHVNISGGTRCHRHGRPERQLDIWIECDPDSTTKGYPAAPPGVPPVFETGYCEYDLFWTSSYACRECVASDYTKILLDPPVKQFDSNAGCRLDGNWTVRYTKKPTSKCTHGVHDGVMTTRDLNEFCDPQDCPHGFKKNKISPDFYDCQPCEPGSTTQDRNSTTCSLCTGNTFAPNKGSDRCEECGHGTKPNAAHTDCVFPTAHCTYITTDSTPRFEYDLSKMGSSQKMAGPVVESYHQYYLNLCSTGQAEHACFNSSNEPLVSYSCQIPQGSSTAKDLGNIMGIWDLNHTELKQYPQGGVKVKLTGGSVCHHVGAQQQRTTDIFVTCDLTSGVGKPTTPGSSPWNPSGLIEPHGACKYEFVWPSAYGCPVCQLRGETATYTKREDVCDPKTGLMTPEYSRTKKCVQPDGNPGSELVKQQATPCIASCAKGYQPQAINATQSKCVACSMGKTSLGGATQCTSCGGNKYTYERGSSECIECGEGTKVNSAHNGCIGLSECQWNLNKELYDLKPLDKANQHSKAKMFGPIIDENANPDNPTEDFQYYLNLCSKQSTDGTSCATDDGRAVESFACQRTTLTSATLGHLKGVSLGDTMGISSQSGNLTVSLTHGTQCHKPPQPFRSTLIDMVCDVSAGLGTPVAYKGNAEISYCKYRFTWNTVQACPVCRETHFEQIVSECQEQIVSGNWAKSTHSRNILPCNPNPAAAFKPVDTEEACEAPGHTAWYKSSGFLITVIVTSSSIFVAVGVFALVKYWKVRKLYETYAQLDKDRGTDVNDFAMPESYDLDSQKRDGGL